MSNIITVWPFQQLINQITTDLGLLPREDIKAMLRSNGDFLVRTTEPVAGQPRAFVLSVMVQQEKEDQGVIKMIKNN